jgi:hypothetical protein
VAISVQMSSPTHLLMREDHKVIGHVAGSLDGHIGNICPSQRDRKGDRDVSLCTSSLRVPALPLSEHLFSFRDVGHVAAVVSPFTGSLHNSPLFQ